MQNDAKGAPNKEWEYRRFLLSRCCVVYLKDRGSAAVGVAY